MELNLLSLQESQTWLTDWRTPLLFLVVQALIVLIVHREYSNYSSYSSSDADEQQDFFATPPYQQLSRLPSFSALAQIRLPSSLPDAVLEGLRKWARRATSNTKPSSDHSPAGVLEKCVYY